MRLKRLKRIKRLNAKVEDNKRINEILKEYYAKEAQKMFGKIERLNDNPDMSSKKSEIINRLIELYNLKQIYYLNKVNNNSEINKTINIASLNSDINELEKGFRYQKGSGMFTSQKEFAKLLTLLAQLHAVNKSKKLKNDINRLLKALYNSKQISELVNENLIEAI